MQTRRQQGVSLVVAMIMLVLITLMTIASFNIGKNTLVVVGNMQHRDEVVVAADGAIQAAMSTERLYESPGNIFLVPCKGPNTMCVDTNADGIKDDVLVTLTPAPSCIQSTTIPVSELSLGDPDPVKAKLAQNCTIMQGQGVQGIEGVPSGASLCADTLWEIRAVAADEITRANVTVTQGTAITVSTDSVAAFCI